MPDEIHQVPGIPRTLSGKKLEVPVRKILLGTPVADAADPDALANPGGARLSSRPLRAAVTAASTGQARMTQDRPTAVSARKAAC